LTTDGKGNISVSGIISGTGGSGITKQGDGTLTLGGANTFDGRVNVNQGVVSVTHALGLGSTSGGTLVGSGAQVQVSGGVSIGENFVIRVVAGGLYRTPLGSFR